MAMDFCRTFSIFLLSAAIAAAADYHVDSAKGSDSADGLTPATAWGGLEKVNAAVFKPGDRILFKSGASWTGLLQPKGSGKIENGKKIPIRIASYGEGPKPRIDGGGLHRDALLLENVEFWEVSGLEITNRGENTAPHRTGVRISSKDFGKMRHIVLRDLHVHDVNGDLRKSHEGCGIFFESTGRESCFDGILIENCHVVRTDRNGICQRGGWHVRSTNVIIRGNLLEDIGGDGIKLWSTNGGLIEKNIVRGARARCKDHAAGIWPFACDDTLIQFNEVSGTKGTMDGQSFDSDYQCRRTVFQYNYSHGNEGGFMLICAPNKEINEGTVIRYNISLHDGVNSARVFHFGGGSSNTRIYNNTVILGTGQDLPMLLFTEWEGGKARDVAFTNNLFIVPQGGRARYDFGPSQGVVFEDNLFVGTHEGLPKGVESAKKAPELTGPLEPTPGLASPVGLRPPWGGKFPRGRKIAGNGGRDYFGTPLPPGTAPAIGAAEPGVGRN